MLDGIASAGQLGTAFAEGVRWCRENLPGRIEKVDGRVDYGRFRFLVDNTISPPDMCLDTRQPGLIRVSPNKIRWYAGREQFYGQNGGIRYAIIGKERREINSGAEADIQSMFVHEIAEYAVMSVPEAFRHYCSKGMRPHAVGCWMENVNRLWRGLKPWPD